jgi:Peptidase family S49
MAAYDPRVAGLLLQLEPLAIGWASVQELAAHIEFFRKSGKPTIAVVRRCRELEFALAATCEEIYIPPTAWVWLSGFSVGGVFVRGTLDKVGVEPEVCPAWLQFGLVNKTCMATVLAYAHLHCCSAALCTPGCSRRIAGSRILEAQLDASAF